MKFKYIIGTGVGTDSIYFPDGRKRENLPGGAGFYALVGLSLWSDSVLITCGIGPEYLARHGNWYQASNCPTEGLTIQSEVTPISIIQYFEDGEREDKPNIGLQEFRKLDPTIPQIKKWVSDETRGVYIFKHLDADFLDALVALRNQYGFRLLWEISADAAIPENVATIEKYIKNVDIFSINKSEAFTLYGTDRIKEITARFQTITKNWVYFRQGKQGAYLVSDGHAILIPSFKKFDVVDPTGAGNSSSTGMLFGMCEGAGPIRSGIMGSISAAYTIRQYGPPEAITPAMRDEAKKLLESTYDEMVIRGYGK